MDFVYRVWFIPTVAGIALGFQPFFVDQFDDKEDAEECAHIERLDDPAPDKREYGDFHVIQRNRSDPS